MLYNVTFGNNTFVSDPWQLITHEGKYFYEKKDINQRIRINPPKSSEDKEKFNESTLKLEPGWKTPQVQMYKFGVPMEYRNNTHNMNSMLRFVEATNNSDKEDLESIVVFVTVVNNYQIIDFETKYQILNTYHKFGMYQGCVVVFNRKELRETKDGTILSVYAYNKKKGIPQMLTVRFNSDVDKRTKKRTINPEALSTHVTPIKDAKEKDRVVKRAQENKNSYLGFKCIVKPKRFLTSVYLVHPDYLNLINDMVRFSNKDVIRVTPALASNHDEMREILKKHCLDKKVRAITTVGINISIHDLRASKILFVFGFDAKRQTLHCLKSN